MAKTFEIIKEDGTKEEVPITDDTYILTQVLLKLEDTLSKLGRVLNK